MKIWHWNFIYQEAIPISRYSFTIIGIPIIKIRWSLWWYFFNGNFFSCTNGPHILKWAQGSNSLVIHLASMGHNGTAEKYFTKVLQIFSTFHENVWLEYKNHMSKRFSSCTNSTIVGACTKHTNTEVRLGRWNMTYLCIQWFTCNDRKQSRVELSVYIQWQICSDQGTV